MSREDEERKGGRREERKGYQVEKIKDVYYVQNFSPISSVSS